ncbi:hypothetical protein D5018_00380 [Parashewanella curva]|uniref:Lipoprotein n=1 Tax=Parashewanella curva TaxID=2338552 RepID=A0A3L8Q294_9GAMM|nr:hypothetical protein [Parashewanella curva]RLV61610.1 hypothetical protein D5018_00380 [Parashewanella curva]
MKKVLIFLLSIWLVACSSSYPNQTVLQETLPVMKGETLDKRSVKIPNNFDDSQTLLLIGYQGPVDLSGLNFVLFEHIPVQGVSGEA